MTYVYAQDSLTPEDMLEMQEAMREMQGMMEGFDPETKKQTEQMMTNPADRWRSASRPW